MKTAGQTWAAKYTIGLVTHFAKTERMSADLTKLTLHVDEVEAYLELAFVAGQTAEREKRPAYTPKEPRLVELNAKAEDRYSRPFMELDADQRAELREEVYDQPAAMEGVCTSEAELEAERENLSPEDRAKLDALPKADGTTLPWGPAYYKDASHPPTDEHLAACPSCMMAHDKALPDA